MPAVALDVVDGAQAGAERGVVDGRVSRLVLAGRLVVTDANVEAPAGAQVPLVIEEERTRAEVGALRRSRDRIPLDLAGIGIRAEHDLTRGDLGAGRNF